MVVVGLTGSIAMGKSTVARMFMQFGVPVFDADAAVRDFYCSAGAESVEKMFPGVLVEGQVDRKRLSELVLSNFEAIKRLEGVVHPAVASARTSFLENARMSRQRIVLVDVPLLFETGDESIVDVIVVVSAQETLQRSRALARGKMTGAKLDFIISRQLTDVEKRRRSHFVIDSSGSNDKTHAQVSQFLRCTYDLM